MKLSRIARAVRRRRHERDEAPARTHQGAVPSSGVIRFEMPEDTLPENHRARLLWRIVQTLDLSVFTAGAKAVEGRQGRPRERPHVADALALRHLGGHRQRPRDCAEDRPDDAFRWIVGDESVGHTKLSEFRVGHREALDKLLTDVLASLLHKGLLSLDLVAQDGTRVRAHASAPSFRREASLVECREQAALHVKAVFAEADDPNASEREKRAREAAALDYQRRVEAAIDTTRELQDEGKHAPRASTTDAEARKMKMGDGGFRPAYNIQFATAGPEMGGPRTIVGVRVTNVGSDMGSVKPMLDQIEHDGALPKVLLADGSHAKHECIRDATKRGVEVRIPVPERANKPDPQADPAIAAWHERMATDEAKRSTAPAPATASCRTPTSSATTAWLRSSSAAPRSTCLALLATLAATCSPTRPRCSPERPRARNRLRAR